MFVCITNIQALSEGGGRFRPYGRGPEHLGAPNCLEFHTRYSGFSVKPIIKQQEKILKSLVQVNENLNLNLKKLLNSPSSKNSTTLS